MSFTLHNKVMQLRRYIILTILFYLSRLHAVNLFKRSYKRLPHLSSADFIWIDQDFLPSGAAGITTSQGEMSNVLCQMCLAKRCSILMHESNYSTTCMHNLLYENMYFYLRLQLFGSVKFCWTFYRTDKIKKLGSRPKHIQRLNKPIIYRCGLRGRLKAYNYK